MKEIFFMFLTIVSLVFSYLSLPRPIKEQINTLVQQLASWLIVLAAFIVIVFFLK